MTENERRILNELRKEAPLSKRDVTRRCGMGWATAVKMMTRLEEEGYIIPFGNQRQAGAGKTASVYRLASGKPAAIGIDIEYARAGAGSRLEQRLPVQRRAGDAGFRGYR